LRLLVVEDDCRLVSVIRRGLRGRALVDIADRGEEALWMSRAKVYDALVLDVMLPGIDGFETCRRLRAAEVWTPILILTARGALEDRIAGLDCGADDYLVKPFALEELAARVRALARREAVPRPAVVEVGSLRLDPATRKVWRDGVEIALTAREFSILEVFMRRPGRVVTREELLDLAWENEYENRSNIVNVYVRYLREKVDRPFGKESLETVWGAGYRLNAV
jgi:two-component system OmpR family response regulator